MDVACFDCADCLGRIRPGMAVQQAAAELQKGKGATDQSLQGDFDGALEQMAEAGGVRFLPGAAVDLGSTYGFRVFQDFGILTKQEYSTLVGVDPKDIGVSPCNLPFKQPGSSTELYLLSLEGLSPDQLASIRKIQVEFGKHVTNSSHYLTPENQLLENQSDFVLPYVFKKLNQEKPAGLNPAAKSFPPLSLSQAREKAGLGDDAPDDEELEVETQEKGMNCRSLWMDWTRIIPKTPRGPNEMLEWMQHLPQRLVMPRARAREHLPNLKQSNLLCEIFQHQRVPCKIHHQ